MMPRCTYKHGWYSKEKKNFLPWCRLGLWKAVDSTSISSSSPKTSKVVANAARISVIGYFHTIAWELPHCTSSRARLRWNCSIFPRLRHTQFTYVLSIRLICHLYLSMYHFLYISLFIFYISWFERSVLINFLLNAISARLQIWYYGNLEIEFSLRVWKTEFVIA